MSERVVAQTDPKFRVDVQVTTRSGPPGHRVETTHWEPEGWFEWHAQAVERMEEIADRHAVVRVVEMKHV